MMPATANTRDGFGFGFGFDYGWLAAYTRQAMSLLHEKNCECAKYLHETRYIYALYGALDGLSLSYSTTKYWFDMLVTRTFTGNVISSDLMHDWMLTPEGLAAVIAETTFLVGFSIMANVIDDEEQFEFRQHKVKLDNGEPIEDKGLYLYLENGVIRCIAKNKKGIVENFVIKDEILGSDAENIKAIIFAKSDQFTRNHLEKIIAATAHRDNVQARLSLYVGWRYGRDMLKGLKNAYKGLRAAMWAMSWLKNDMRFLLFPTALTFGILSGINRIWYRSMKDHRKLLQTNNKDLAILIRELDYLSQIDAQIYLSKIGSQSNPDRVAGLLSQVYGGLVDGLYLYMGVLMLAPVSPLVFGFLAGCATLFVFLCILTRVFTEYEYQRKLVVSALTVELAVCGKRIESLFLDMQSEEVLSDDYNIIRLNAELVESMDNFSRLQKLRWGESSLTQGLVVLSGLRDGLAAGGAVGSFMFAIVTILSMTVAPCPPLFVIACMVTSLALVIAGLACAIITNWSADEAPKAPRSAIALNDLLTDLKNKKLTIQNLKLEDASRVIWDSMEMDPSPLFFWQEWAEVFRSLFSGLAKGQKAVDLTLNPLQDVDEQGHSHDSSFMIWATCIYSVVFALVLALRSDAREFNEKAKKVNPVLPDLTDADSASSGPHQGGSSDDTSTLPPSVRLGRNHLSSLLFWTSNNSHDERGAGSTKPRFFKPRDRAHSDSDLVSRVKVLPNISLCRDDAPDSPVHF